MMMKIWDASAHMPMQAVHTQFSFARVPHDQRAISCPLLCQQLDNAVATYCVHDIGARVRVVFNYLIGLFQYIYTGWDNHTKVFHPAAQ